jgi:hypothetical protein
MDEMLIDEIDHEMIEYGHFVDTEEDLLELAASTVENSNKKDDDYYRSRKSIEELINHSIQTKATQIEKSIIFVHVGYLMGIGFLCYCLYKG